MVGLDFIRRYSKWGYSKTDILIFNSKFCFEETADILVYSLPVRIRAQFTY
jgi:hypothetical protein